MTKVVCDTSTCEFWRKGVCQLTQIELECEECTSFAAHTDLSKEYRETFWKRIKNAKTGEFFRVERQGKRYELLGMTFYTDYDDRWGTDTVWFTEKESGLLILGKDIDEEHLERIRENIRKYGPVESLPEGRETI